MKLKVKSDFGEAVFSSVGRAAKELGLPAQSIHYALKFGQGTVTRRVDRTQYHFSPAEPPYPPIAINGEFKTVKKAAEHFEVTPNALYTTLSRKKAEIKPGVFIEFHKGKKFE